MKDTTDKASCMCCHKSIPKDKAMKIDETDMTTIFCSSKCRDHWEGKSGHS